MTACFVPTKDANLSSNARTRVPIVTFCSSRASSGPTDLLRTIKGHGEGTFLCRNWRQQFEMLTHQIIDCGPEHPPTIVNLASAVGHGVLGQMGRGHPRDATGTLTSSPSKPLIQVEVSF